MYAPKARSAIVSLTYVDLMAENMVENSFGLGSFHCRLLRTLKRKGYLMETDIQLFSQLPLVDTRVAINQLMVRGFLDKLIIAQGP